MAKPKRDAFRLNQDDLRKLYSTRRFLGTELREKAGLSIPFDVYFQDPSVAERDPDLDFDRECCVDWEPHLAAGPTSARFAVVDFNSDTSSLAPPAQWDESQLKFVHDGLILDREVKGKLQYHQVSVWAILQRALAFFEEPNGLGRRIPWGFDGNRLLVVPHAGYGKNAYYDRQSKSLQFYYFDKEGGGQVFTCLSTDIVHHEFGHAVLDGLRPFLSEATSLETAAFHEAFGDLTAILVILRSNNFRGRLALTTQGDLTGGEHTLSGVAEEFGKEVNGRPSLRDAKNEFKMSDVAATTSHHKKSQVLSGAMYDILLALAEHYRVRRGRTAPQALWDLIQRMQRTVVQPLDFLPPVDVTFRDYALAVVRAHELADPRDPHRYRDLIIDAFVRREILGAAEGQDLKESGYGYLHNRLDLDIVHPIEQISRSKADAYRFLDDNRAALELPPNRDILVADLYTAEKAARQGLRMPRQIILEYLWREDILLEETPLAQPRFGRFAGEWTSLLCGGTLVFDENSTVLWWVRKPNSEERRELFLDDLARKIRSGQIGSLLGGEQGLVGAAMAPFVERRVDGGLRIDLAPHFGIADDEEEEGERPWAISC